MLGTLLAIALQTSSTNCYPVGNTVQCDTYGSPSAPPAYQQPQSGFNAMQSMQAYQMGRDAARQDAPEPPPGYVPNSAPSHPPIFGQNAANIIFRDELARRMSAYINQRRCREAYDLASLAGEAEMAQRSANLCAY